jgi:hypothetical protein
MNADYMMQYTQGRKCAHSVTVLALSHLLWFLKLLKCPLCNYLKTVRIMDKIQGGSNITGTDLCVNKPPATSLF